VAILLDTLSALTVKDLQDQGFLVSGCECIGTLKWSTRSNQIVLTVRVQVDEPSGYLTFQSANSVQAVSLERCPSNLGVGHRFYFVVDGVRAYKLYRYGGRFVSRRQIPGAMYESQVEGKRWRVYRQYFEADRKALQIITRKGFTPSYRGRPTRAFQRYLKAVDTIEGFNLH